MQELFTIFTETETAEILKIDEVTLRNYRRRHKIHSFRQGNRWFYMPDAIKQYLKKIGAECEENPDSNDSEIRLERSNPPIGTSSITTAKEVAASLRGIELAKKTRKRISHSRNSSLNAKGPQLVNQLSY